MIKFFRKIRQNLLSEGNTIKYLKYAFGEILLVVIGILIALQINNWKTNSENRRIENNYYCQFLDDLNKDKVQLQTLIEEAHNSIESGKQLIKELHSFKYDKDEIMAKYTIAIRSTSFIPTDIAYTDLTSSGNLSLLKNEKTKQLLIQYHRDIKAILSKVNSNKTYRLDKFMELDNVLEFGWQSPSISKDLNLDEDLRALLPDNQWHLNKSNFYFQKCQEIVFYSMTVSDRNIQLYNEIKNISGKLSLQLEKVCERN